MVFKETFLIIVFSFFFLKSFHTKTITVTWTAPDTPPANGAETLKAIDRHLFALHAASYLPRLLRLQNKVTIKLCPPLPNDPLIKEFTVPHMAAYSLLYDHDCIRSAMSTKSPAWGSKPKDPAVPPEGPEKKKKKFLIAGMTVTKFIMEIRKFAAKPDSDSTENPDSVWLLDSDSLRGWFKGPLLRSFYDRDSSTVPGHDLMRQINTMYAGVYDSNLKDFPQAVQGALLVLLPNYSDWNNRFTIKKQILNPTWWSTRFVPNSKKQLLDLLRKRIDEIRIANQLVIVVHDPTTINNELISSLQFIYGEDSLVSASKILPKQTTTLQLLQFIQKAGTVILDSRDQLGQTSLLSLGFSNRVHILQNGFGRTWIELLYFGVISIAFFIYIAGLIVFTRRNYSDPLNDHLLRISISFLISCLACTALIPSLWPKKLSIGLFNVFEMGLETILYAIFGVYILALIITFIAILMEKQKVKKKQREAAAESFDSDNHSNDEEFRISEEIPLINH